MAKSISSWPLIPDLVVSCELRLSDSHYTVYEPRKDGKSITTTLVGFIIISDSFRILVFLLLWGYPQSSRVEKSPCACFVSALHWLNQLIISYLTCKTQTDGQIFPFPLDTRTLLNAEPWRQYKSCLFSCMSVSLNLNVYLHFLSFYLSHFSVLYWHNCGITVPHTILPKHSVNTEMILLGMKMKTGIGENENINNSQTYP